MIHKRIPHHLKNNLNLGHNDVKADVNEYSGGGNIKWLKINNFKYENTN